MSLVLLVVFFIVTFLGLYMVYVAKFMRWQADNTRGDAFFSRTLDERRALKSRIKRQAPFVLPVFKLLAVIFPQKTPPLFELEGVSGPRAIASKKSYQAAADFKAGKDDIFIATQMKCGTTWMQQVVFEILHKGQGDLSDAGYRHMYALSPWIETSPMASVSIEQAPKVSEFQKRLIKTHLPTRLCPFDKRAKYIYVTRHPVSCYASAVDFMEFLMGPLAPKRQHLLAWFCSERFFFLNWAKHVEGWWQWACRYDNVMFVHFELLKADPGKVIDQIVDFLGLSLTEAEREQVINKSSFQYMKDMEENFEMSPPSIFSMSSSKRFMQSGKSQRHKDVSDEDRQAINRYMASQLQGSSYPLKRFYPDVLE